MHYINENEKGKKRENILEKIVLKLSKAKIVN